jgi:hypothetical protein
MTLKNLFKTPFPWFGGKSDAAPHVWEALGDVAHYVEPFAGSLAVLMRRPHVANRTYYSETVNDADGLLVNAWRSIQMSPDATANAASWPVSEADLHARHLALLRWRSERQLEHLMGDPLWHDPVMAGWWMWGQSCWIGSGWCSGDGAWVVGDDGRIEKRSARANGNMGVRRGVPHISDDGKGTNRPQLREEGVGRKIPYISDDGKGTNTAAVREEGVGRQIPFLSSDGKGTNTAAVREEGVAYATEYHPMTMPELRRWFAFLSAYADTAERMGNIYTHDDLQVAHAAREWAIKAGTDPKIRIVFAGFDDEHGTAFTDAGWREIEWYKAGFLKGGMGNVGGTGNTQMTRDRLWLSPNCLEPAKPMVQSSLF